ncbi:MAG TPA: glycosyltransferase family 39 protein [Vicinamibacterales bacterium]|nr:glycosyltransferase family 39 protein [Vicinamibacterales bacterium]
MKEHARIFGRRLLVVAAVLTPLLALTMPARRLAQLPQRVLIAGAAAALLATAVLGLRRARWTRDVPFLCILLVAGLARLWLATTERYVHDEINTAIPLARTISLRAGQVHLPLRGENHPALPAYVVKASGEFFGRNAAGYRMLSLLLGLVLIVLIYSLSVDTLGPIAARWAAALLAFNGYYLGVSARATAHVPHLLLVTVAMYAYARFLRTQRAAFIYAAAVSAGLAFYAKEHSALVMPIFFLALLTSGQRRWLRTPHPYLASVLFVACISPDLYWNAQTRKERVVNYAGEEVRQATYADHFSRFGGVSLSPYPTMFYMKPLAQAAARQLTGVTPPDHTPEYRSVNPLLGLVLLGAVVFTVAARRVGDDLQRFLVIQFGFVFVLFSLIQPGNPPGRLDAVSWIWVETTILPAAVLTGARLAETAGWRRRASWSIVSALLGWSVVSTLV